MEENQEKDFMNTINKNIKTEVNENGIFIIKISRPEALNALNTEVLKELKEVLTVAEKDPSVRVVVFTGDGDKSFIAGADISEMAGKSIRDGTLFAQLGQEITKQLELMSKPTIAAVNGFALGGGTEFALCCDFILASEKAVFGQPEVCLGIIPGFGGTLRLARFVGYPKAKELIYSGQKIKADEALRIGLVNHVYPADGFMGYVLELAKKISLNSFPAVSICKKLLNEFSETIGLNTKLDAEAHEFGLLFGSHDQKEGMSAFLEKRAAKFQGL